MSLHTDERPTRQELEALRRAFAASADETPDPDACPDADLLWAATRRELDAEQTLELIEHTASCPACAEAWRLARDLADSHGERDGANGRTLSMAHRFRRAAPLVGLAAAAMLAVVLGRPTRSPDPPEMRAGDTVEIRSLVPDDRVLPRDRCLLQWTGIEGARYSVLVSGPDLVPVAQVEDLEQPRLLIPRESLVGLGPGTRLYWQVQAILDDGTTKSSKTFVGRLE